MQTPSERTVDLSADAELITRCLGGDESAWEELIKRYRRLIYSIPLRYGLDQEAAADIFQSVCVALLEHLSGLKDRGKLSSWIITTTTRECWRSANRGRREAPIGQGGEPSEDGRFIPEVADTRPLAEEEQLALERQQQLREAVSALPERCQTLLQLLYFAEERPSYEEISRRLEMPVPSIGPTRARCLEKLKKLMP